MFYLHSLCGLKIKNSIMFSFVLSIVNIGMWFERFVIIVTSLHRDYLPSSWTMFSPTFVDRDFIGTIGFFFVLFYCTLGLFL
jgi:molybdopterin-containing oxidoreductase family membrane subunit